MQLFPDEKYFQYLRFSVLTLEQFTILAEYHIYSSSSLACFSEMAVACIRGSVIHGNGERDPAKFVASLSNWAAWARGNGIAVPKEWIQAESIVSAQALPTTHKKDDKQIRVDLPKNNASQDRPLESYRPREECEDKMMVKGGFCKTI